MHRKPVPLLPGSCCLSDEPVAEIVQCGDARSEDAPRGKLRSNFGATTPKHHRKPGTIRYQKTKPGITINNPVRSAKPPSPVQIRAAPPIPNLGKTVTAGAVVSSGTADFASFRSITPNDNAQVGQVVSVERRLRLAMERGARKAIGHSAAGSSRRPLARSNLLFGLGRRSRG